MLLYLPRKPRVCSGCSVCDAAGHGRWWSSVRLFGSARGVHADGRSQRRRSSDPTLAQSSKHCHRIALRLPARCLLSVGARGLIGIVVSYRALVVSDAGAGRPAVRYCGLCADEMVNLAMVQTWLAHNPIGKGSAQTVAGADSGNAETPGTCCTCKVAALRTPTRSLREVPNGCAV